MAVQSSWPGLLLCSKDSGFELCQELIGKWFYSIAAQDNAIYACCKGGAKKVSLKDGSVEDLTSVELLTISGGKGFTIGLASDRSLYSWGFNGYQGQLGSGIKHTSAPVASKIHGWSDFVQISTGEAFCTALANSGQLFGFGENYNRQLALYTKTKEKMHLTNAMVEEVVFSPRIMPFTMTCSVRKVCCGKQFVMAIGTRGELYSWGAGECGQLGTGRCTLKAIPSAVRFEDYADGEAKVRDVACGDGHVIAVLDNDDFYAWGLNHRGQCGVTADKAAPKPRKLPSISRLKLIKLFANEHCSAAIDIQGCLYTWGSTSRGRLVHHLPPEQTHIDEPKPVEIKAYSKTPIEWFAFAATGSAAIIRTALTKIYPTRGPKKTFSKIFIHGYGLWDSPQIIVKFASKVFSAYNPPRSCIGRFDPAGCITCKPPKFVEGGLYTVMVSMDGGKEYLNESFEIFVYKEPLISNQSPAVLDLRQPFIPPLSLKVQVGKEVVDLCQEVAVRLLLFKVLDDSTSPTRGHQSFSAPPLPAYHPSQCTREVRVRGLLTSEAPAQSPPEEEDVLSVGSVNKAAEQQTIVITTEEVAMQRVTDDLPLHLYEMICQISLNDQDFSGFGKESKEKEFQVTLCHTFSPEQICPGFYPLTTVQEVTNLSKTTDFDPHSYERKLVVRGLSMFPPAKVMKSVHLKASFGACVPIYQPGHASTIAAENGEPAETAEESSVSTIVDDLLVHCDTLDSCHLTLSSNCLQQIHEYLVEMHGSDFMKAEGLLAYRMEVFFFMEQPAVERGGASLRSLLSPQPLHLHFYMPLPLCISPPAARMADASSQFVLKPVHYSSGFALPPNDATVQLVSKDIATAKPLLLSPQDVRIITMPTSNKEEGEILEALIPQQTETFAIEVTLPSYSEIVDEMVADRPELADLRGKMVNFLVQVALDGHTYTSDTESATLIFCQSFAHYVLVNPPPKGGFPGGTAISLQLEQAVPPFPKVAVRLRGESVANALVLPAEMVESAGVTVVNFTLPEAASFAKMSPGAVNGKEKLFYIDVSVDNGLSFDEAERPQVQLKC